MLRKTTIDKESFWNAPMSRKDWAVLYAASFVIGCAVSLGTVWPLIGDSIKRDVEDVIDGVKEKLDPSYKWIKEHNWAFPSKDSDEDESDY